MCMNLFTVTSILSIWKIEQKTLDKKRTRNSQKQVGRWYKIQESKEREFKLISRKSWGKIKRRGVKKKKLLKTPCKSKSNTNNVVEEHISSDTIHSAGQ